MSSSFHFSGEDMILFDELARRFPYPTAILIDGALGSLGLACAPLELFLGVDWVRQPRLAAKCLRPFGTVWPVNIGEKFD